MLIRPSHVQRCWLLTALIWNQKLSILKVNMRTGWAFPQIYFWEEMTWVMCIGNKTQSIFWNVYVFVYVKGNKIHQKISEPFPVLFYLLKERNNNSNHRKIWNADSRNNKHSLKCLEDISVSSIECFPVWAFSEVTGADPVPVVQTLSLPGSCAVNALGLSPLSQQQWHISPVCFPMCCSADVGHSVSLHTGYLRASQAHVQLGLSGESWVRQIFLPQHPYKSKQPCAAT